jgi:hypothetical protein
MVETLDFSHDGHLIVSCSQDDVVCIWDMETGEHKTLPIMHVDVCVLVTACCMSHADTFIVFVVCCVICRVTLVEYLLPSPHMGASLLQATQTMLCAFGMSKQGNSSRVLWGTMCMHYQHGIHT